MDKKLNELIEQVNYYITLAKNTPTKAAAYNGMAVAILYRHPEILQYLNVSIR